MSGVRRIGLPRRLPEDAGVSFLRKTPQRKTLLSNWKIRNDSSKVNAILHPELDLESPRRFIHDVPDKPSGKSKAREVFRKCCLSTNNCYCRDKPIKPKILAKPEKCLALEEIGRRIGSDDLSRTSLQCFCKVATAEVPDSELMKKYKEELDNRSTALQLTEQRRDYEVYREDQENEFLRQIEKYETEQTNLSEVEDDDGYITEEQFREPHSVSNEAYSVSTLLGTRVAKSDIGSSGFVSEGLDIEDIRKFRNDHYFETHDVDHHQTRDFPDHTCIHQFRLDERFLPNPLNADVYGRSRCLICSKPMEGEKIQSSKSYLADDKSTNRSLSSFSKCYELGLFPRVINIGGDKSKVTIKLSDNQMKFEHLLSKCRKPEYTNTFALRQQKMSC